jgi:ribosomal protein L35
MGSNKRLRKTRNGATKLCSKCGAKLVTGKGRRGYRNLRVRAVMTQATTGNYGTAMPSIAVNYIVA